MQAQLCKDSLTPPKGVQAACKRGLELRPEHGGDGLTDAAVARARSMASGSAVSAETLRRIKAYHARHVETKQSSPPSPGYVAYLLWGGDAGKSWAEAKADTVEKAAKKKRKKKLVGGNKGAWAHAKEQAKGKKNPDAYAAKIYSNITKKSLVKAEGSRGGHVIGHTRSGKPIYAYRHGPSGNPFVSFHHDHVDFSGDDHQDAHNFYKKRNASDQESEHDDTSSSWHEQARDALTNHRYHSEDHDAAALNHENASKAIGRMANIVVFGPKGPDRIPDQMHLPDHFMSDLGDKSLEHDQNAFMYRVKSAHKKGKSLPTELYETVSKSSPSSGSAFQKTEGSRGGHVIGHTKSGKAIYASADHSHEIYGGFTSQDHSDAADAHRKAGSEHNDKARAARGKDSKVVHESAFAIGHHEFKAKAHDFAARMLAAGHKIWKSGKKGEGSRGGQITGHTQSGKPIYAATHKTYERTVSAYDDGDLGHQVVTEHPGWSSQDHLDAAEAHAQVAGSTPDRDLRHRSHAASQAHSMASMDGGIRKEHKGEGSRGGHIIGHTKSGKPIYSLHHDMNRVKGKAALHATHELIGYTPKDHADAASRHMARYQRLSGSKPNRAMKHLKLAADHSAIATGRDVMKPLKTPKAEMSGMTSTFDNHKGLASFHLREADMKVKVAPDEALWHYAQAGLHSDKAMAMRQRLS